MIITNADERIEITDITRTGDSIIFRLPYFQTEIQAIVSDSGRLSGRWNDYSRGPDYYLPFEGIPNTSSRFDEEENAATNAMACPRKRLRRRVVPFMISQIKCAFKGLSS